MTQDYFKNSTLKLGKKIKFFSPWSSPSDFMMKTQLFGSSWCISAIHFATFNTSCKPANTTTLENVSNVNKTIKFCIWIIRHTKFCVEFWRDFYFPVSKRLLLHMKEVVVVARSEIRMGRVVRQIDRIFMLSGPIFIAALDITLGLQKVTISCSNLYTLLIH